MIARPELIARCVAEALCKACRKLGSRRRVVRLVVGVFLTGALACEEPPRAWAVARLGWVAEPPGLIARVFVADPQQVFTQIRQELRGAELIPNQLGVLVARALGLPLAVSGRILPHRAVGALGAEQGSLFWALGLPIASGHELVAELTTGSAPRFRANHRGAVTEISGGELPFAIVDRWLVIASSRAPLPRYAESLARGNWPEAKDSDVTLELADDGAANLDELFGSRLTHLLDLLPSRVPLASSPEDASRREMLVDGFERWVTEFRATGLDIASAKVWMRSDGPQTRWEAELVSRARESTEPTPAARERCRSSVALPGRLRWALWVSSEALFDESGRGLEPWVVEPFFESVAAPLWWGTADVDGSSLVFWSAARRKPQRQDWDPGAVPEPFVSALTSAVPSPALPSPPLPADPSGSSSRARATAHLAWRERDMAVWWAHGSGEAPERWLHAPLPQRLPFDSWQNVCEGSPRLLAGVHLADGELSVSLTRVGKRLRLRANSPLAFWAELAQAVLE